MNTFLCVGLGFSIDKWGGPLLSLILATFHMGGAIVMAGAATNMNSYPLLIVGKVIAAVGDGSLDNAQHRIFSTYFARGGGFAFSIGGSTQYPILRRVLTFFAALTKVLSGASFRIGNARAKADYIEIGR